MEFTEHISEETLEQYALGKLADSEIEPLEMHLLVCETCQDRLKHLDEFMAALYAAAREIAQEMPEQSG